MEIEADEVGLELAAKACYNVNYSVKYWSEFEEKKQVKTANTSKEMEVKRKNNELFSTHPSSKKRAENLENLLPKVII